VNRAALVEAARESIRRGSKSFAAASRLFDRTTRERVWLLYTWCRACDDLADGQDHGGPQGSGPAYGEGFSLDGESRLATIRTLTELAFAGERTGVPAFDALGELAREVPITRAMAEDVIGGFALDTAGWRPRTEADLLRYCFHVAGAVGVMMGVVMGVPAGDDDTLDRACDLGIAFQLSNILRDLAEDEVMGRCYLPADWLVEQGIGEGELMAPWNRPVLLALVRHYCDLVEIYEASARVGAGRLAFRQRWAVLSAARIYGGIGREVARRGAEAWDDRVRTSRAEKLACVARALAEACLSPAQPGVKPPLSRRDLAAMARR